jgi:hypothetical protein
MGLPLQSPGVVYRSDSLNRVRFINQNSQPYKNADVSTAKALADAYIQDAVGDFGLDAVELNLSATPSPDLNANFTELRYIDETSRETLSSQHYTLTYFGIPIWMKGIAVDTVFEELKIVRASSTLTYDSIEMEAPDPPVLDNYSGISAAQLGELLNIQDDSEITITNSDYLLLYNTILIHA